MNSTLPKHILGEPVVITIGCLHYQSLIGIISAQVEASSLPSCLVSNEDQLLGIPARTVKQQAKSGKAKPSPKVHNHNVGLDHIH